MTNSSLNVAGPEGNNGFVINGINTSGSDFLGLSVSSAGDVNGDGIDDLIIGAPAVGGWFDDGSDYWAGKTYVVFGGTAVGAGGSFDLSSLDGSNGFVLNGTGAEGRRHLGYSVSNAGDINGDGFGDLIIGASSSYFSNGSQRTYVVFGGANVGSSGSIDKDALDGTNGFVLIDEHLIPIMGVNGTSVSGAGDINGDGFDDLIIGFPQAYTDYGGAYSHSYVVFGGSNVGSDGSIVLSSLNGSNGFHIQEINRFDGTGKSVSNAGDINGDGFDDVIIGAYRADPNGYSSGASYVVFGNYYVGYSGSIDLSTLDGTNGFVINGLAASDTLGFSVSSAGDVNGDGFADLIIGAPDADPNGTYSGASYVVFGGYYVGYSGSIDLSTLDGSYGFIINGLAAGDRSGNCVSSAGDINNDGFDDVIIGAYIANSNGNNSGASYVVFGGSYVGYSGSIDLSTLDGSNGFAIDGIASFGWTGFSVSGAGDINNDGFDDLIIGAPQASDLSRGYAGFALGASYVVFGSTNVGNSGSIDLSNLNASNESNSLVINGINTADFLGFSVSSAGDVNGDGIDDLIIGAPGGWFDDGSDYWAGKTYVVFGGTAVGTGGSFDLSSLDGSNGFVLSGTAAEGRRYLGYSVSDAGDINGDGFGDLIIGACSNYISNGSQRTYVVFGGANVGSSGSIDKDALDGTNGFVLIDEHSIPIFGDNGTSVSGAGDINGDGFDDLIIGFPQAYTDYGGAYSHSYVVFGGSNVGLDGSIVLSSLNGSNGFHIQEINQFDGTGKSVSNAGDINGDGFDDIIIGAYRADPNGNSSGASYVVFGGYYVGYSGSIDLSTLDGTNGFVINGLAASDNLGLSVSSAGDVNGDGFADLIIGAPDADPNGNSSGASYVVFGGYYVGYSGSIDLSTLDGSYGFIINGLAAGDRSGFSVSSAGDINGDGFDDLIIGAPRANSNGNSSGASYVVFGGYYVGYSGSIDLSTLDGSNGFAIDGIARFGQTGSSVSGAGDINDDGFDDLIIGAPRASDLSGSYAGYALGASYVVFGGTNVGNSGSIDLSNLNASNDSNSLVINGTDAGDLLGYSVSSAGDINGDGFDDLIIGAPGAFSDDSPGKTYVVFGNSSVGYSGSIDLSTLDGTNGFVLNGTTEGESLGVSVSDAGDINGDGFADLIIGVNNPYFFSGSDRTYVVFGGSYVGYSGSIDLDTLDGTNGFTLNNDDIGYAYSSVSGAGDVNGDGIDDLIIGVPSSYFNGERGYSYVVFGGTTVGEDGTIDFFELDGNNGFRIEGINPGDSVGRSVSSAGDVNGDGFDDLIIGAPFADPNGNDSGASYVVFGNYYAGYDGSIDLSTLDGSNGFVINGLTEDDRLGNSVSSAGDINGDGFADLIIGAFRADSYVVFGGAYVGYSGSIDLSTLDGTYGFVINGAATGDASGTSVSGAGDINGDGFADLIIGAPYADPNGNSSGASYVLFGGTYVGYSGSIDLSTLSGVSANNLLDSGEADDLLYGGLSNAYPVAGEVHGAIAGSTGSDRFLLSADQPTDRITNFEDGQDSLILSNGLTFEQLKISQSNSDTLISLKNTGEVLANLTGVSANLITESDFLTF